MAKPRFTNTTAEALKGLAARIRELGEDDHKLVQSANRKALEFMERLAEWKLDPKE